MNYICSRCKCETPDIISSYLIKQCKWVKIKDVDYKETPDMFVLCPKCYIAFIAFSQGQEIENEDEIVDSAVTPLFDNLDEAGNLHWIEDTPGIYRCPNCGHTEGKQRNYCEDCGCKFVIGGD